MCLGKEGVMGVLLPILTWKPIILFRNRTLYEMVYCKFHVSEKRLENSLLMSRALPKRGVRAFTVQWFEFPLLRSTKKALFLQPIYIPFLTSDFYRTGPFGNLVTKSWLILNFKLNFGRRLFTKLRNGPVWKIHEVGSGIYPVSWWLLYSTVCIIFCYNFQVGGYDGISVRSSIIKMDISSGDKQVFSLLFCISSCPSF